MPGAVDITAYFQRIGFTGAAAAELGTLRELHRLHPMSIPFENLGTLLREPIRLDVDSLQRKLVTRRRGGYCFEHNGLFAEVLRALGFGVVGLAARVVWNPDQPPGPRTHMVLRVNAGGRDYLCDVGFGGLTMSGPLALETGIEQRTPHETFRLLERGAELELEARIRDEWRALYRFDLQEQLPVDFEAMNYYVATHPTSHFLTVLMAARRTADGRYALTNNELAVYRETEKEERLIETGAELARVLEQMFGIALPRGPALDFVLDSIASQQVREI